MNEKSYLRIWGIARLPVANGIFAIPFMKQEKVTYWMFSFSLSSNNDNQTKIKILSQKIQIDCSSNYKDKKYNKRSHGQYELFSKSKNERET